MDILGRELNQNEPDQTQASSYILGVDIGTTSVKVCLLDSKTQDVLACFAEDHHADAVSDVGAVGSEQEVWKLISTLNLCVGQIPIKQRERVSYVGVCGQMHGCVLWKTDANSTGRDETDKLKVPSLVSPLYTWQDARCDTTFLNSLPKPPSPLHTGFACATLLWLQRHRPTFLAGFDRCGTIMDLVVSLLLGLDRPITSPQVATSMGYFWTDEGWDEKALTGAGLSINLLPRVGESGDLVGVMTKAWCGIPLGVKVCSGFGDLQCSVRAILAFDNKGSQFTDAVINVSTSAQVAFVMPPEFKPSKWEGGKIDPVQYFPYMQGYLAVAASLTGGNALAAFVQTIQGWCSELGVSIGQEHVWNCLLERAQNAPSTSMPEPSTRMSIVPTLWGERHDPQAKASVHDIRMENLDLGSLTRSLCRGLVENLASMLSRSQLQDAGINRLLGSGGALARNPVLQHEVRDVYQLPLTMVGEREACLGAALAIFDRHCAPQATVTI